MRAAFLGTPSAAVPSLASLLQIADVESVVTLPPKPQGRGQHLAEAPVAIAAKEWGLPIIKPDSGAELAGALAELDLDVAVVVAYGRILEPDVLATARVGFVNAHFSLLPRWRGAAPAERAILAGDEITGVSLMLIDAGLDTGPVIAVHETDVSDDETGGSLTGRLGDIAGALFGDVLADFVRGRRTPAPQIEAGAVPAPRLKKAEARLDLEAGAEVMARQVRAFHPRPGAWISIDGVRIKVLKVRVADVDVPAGRLEVVRGSPFLGSALGAIELLEVQPAGKRVMMGGAWANGRRGAAGAVDGIS